MTLIRSVLFTVVLFISVACFCPFVIAARIFGARASYSVGWLWSRFAIWSCNVLCGLNFSIEGRENIPEQNAVVLMKHASTYETIVQWSLFPRQCWVLKRELMWAPFLGWSLAALQPIAIVRNAGRLAVEQVVEQGKKRLDDGLWVIIFPEGTRMPPGETRRYGVSGPLLAQAAGCSLIPVAHNAGEFWQRRGWLKKPGTIRVVIGPQIETRDRTAREINSDAQRFIEATLERISNVPEL